MAWQSSMCIRNQVLGIRFPRGGFEVGRGNDDDTMIFPCSFDGRTERRMTCSQEKK